MLFGRIVDEFINSSGFQAVWIQFFCYLAQARSSVYNDDRISIFERMLPTLSCIHPLLSIIVLLFWGQSQRFAGNRFIRMRVQI